MADGRAARGSAAADRATVDRGCTGALTAPFINPSDRCVR